MTTGMDYRDAYKSTTAGKMISRESWPGGMHLFQPDPSTGKLYINSVENNPKPYSATMEDVHATDWYIFND